MVLGEPGAPLRAAARRDPRALAHAAGRSSRSSGGRGSTGRPAASHARQPPISARALRCPFSCSSRVTRTLVASFLHVQYETSQVSSGRPHEETTSTARSGGTRTAPAARTGLSR